MSIPTTQGEFVSRVINSVNSLTKDDHLSRRYILKIGKDKVRTYTSQKLKDNTLFREDSLFQTINCLELKEIDVVSCPIIEFRRCRVLMRSKERLPELIYSQYGASVGMVTNIDDSAEIKVKQLRTYINSRNRIIKSSKPIAYINDGYLYIPDHKIVGVNIEVLTQDVKRANDISGCAQYDKCMSVWDYPFICPDKILENIVRETALEIAQIKRRIPIDENPNNDSNQRSSTIV